MQLQKPKHTRSILTVKAGESVPEALLLKLCSENPSALGVMFRDGTKIEYEKHGTQDSPMEDTPEKLFTMVRTILRSQKKYPGMLVFHDMPAEFDEDEIQPYFIKDGKGKPVMAFAFEGDFPGRDIDGSSEMLGLLTEYLGPKLDETFRFCGNQPNKLFNLIKGDSFANDLKNTYSHRAEFVFFPNDGDPFALGKNDLGLSSSGWGTCSNVYGYTEAVIEAASPEIKEPSKSKFADTGDDDVKPVKAETKVDDKGIHHMSEPKPEIIPPQVEPKPISDPIVKVAAETPEGHWETPPATVHGKDLKKWYRAMNAKNGEMDSDGRSGALPADWEKRPRVFIKTKVVAKSLAELGQTAIGTTVNENANLPVISGAEQASINDYIKKYTSDRVVDSPLELQKQESKLAVFSELSLKKGLSEINGWSVAFINGLCRTHPEAAWLLIVEMRRKIINLEASLSAGDKKLGELTGTQHTPATIPAPASKPLTPSQDDEVIPVKKVSKYA